MIEEPPTGLLLPPMPAQELGEQPSGMLLPASFRGVRVNPRAQTLCDLSRDSEILGQALWRFAVPRSRPRDVLAQFTTEALQPIAEEPGTQYIVSVVFPDPVQV